MSGAMSELKIAATLQNLDAVLGFVGARLGDCPAKARNQIAVAVDEIFSNIARYAYHTNTGGVTIRIAVGHEIVIEFEDSGIPYDPLSADAPDISLPAEAREIGGLGIFMVKNIMDSVEYRRDGDKNILTIRKKNAQATRRVPEVLE